MATANLTHSAPAFAPQTPFVNEPFVDFSQPENKRRMQATLADVQEKLGREYDIVIGGKRLKTAGKILSMNPARPAVSKSGSGSPKLPASRAIWSSPNAVCFPPSVTRWMRT